MIYFEDNFPGWLGTGVNFKKSVSVNGMTANGNSAIDFSASTGAFKFPSGAVSGMVPNVIDVTASTATLTAAQSGSTVLLDRAAGTTVTLPAPTAGVWYRFIVPTSVTSNSYKVITNSASVFVLGQLDLPVAAGTAKLFFADGATHVSINGNGTTTGGLAGSQFTLTCISSTLWNVEGTWDASGTVATPFATS